MKRILSALLIMLLGVLIPFSTVQAEGSDNLNYLLGADKADSLASTQDALWLLSGDRLWRWRPGLAEAELAAERVPSAFQTPDDPQELGYLAADQDRLYSFHPALGTLSAVSVAEGGVRLTDTIRYPLDLLLDAEGHPKMVKNGCMNRPGLWLLAENDAGDGFDLLLLDRTGQVKSAEVKNVRSISAYGEDKLLLIIAQEGKKPVLSEYDPAKGKTKTLIKALPPDADGLCYDAAGKTAYYFTKGEIIARPRMGKAKSAAYLPAVYLYHSPALIGGRLAAAVPEGVFIRSLTGDRADRPAVRVYNLDEFTLNRVRALLPDIKVTVSDSGLSAMELAQAVLSDSFPYDVAVLDIRNPQLYSLMEKGYFAPLDQFPASARAAERVYPVFLKPVTRLSALYALPFSISISDFGYNRKYLDLVGMTAEDLPGDLLSVMDYLEKWQREYSAYDGDVMPLIFAEKSYLKTEMINLYIRQYQLHGLPLSFDTPLFRQMMERIDSLDNDYFSGLRDNFQDGWTSRVILQSNLDLRNLGRNRQAAFSGDGPTYPLCINLEPGLPAVYPYRASYAAVMTRAADHQAAASVAAAICQADWGQMDAPVLFADYQPLVSENYRQGRLSMQEYQKSLKKQIKQAEGAEKTNLEQELAELENRLAELEKEKYVVTEEELEAYRRDLLPYLRPLGPTPHEDSTMQMSEDLSFFFLLRQIEDGSIDTEQFIRQAEHKLRLMEKEGGQ